MTQPSSIILPNGDGRFGREITADYNEINILETDDVKFGKVEMWIAKKIGTELIKHYPNRQWGVKVDAPAQMLIISCNSVSYEKGYHISMHLRNIDELQRRAVKAAGEILERHDLSRARRFDADILETLPRDHKDNVIVADGSAKPDPIDKKPVRD